MAVARELSVDPVELKRVIGALSEFNISQWLLRSMYATYVNKSQWAVKLDRLRCVGQQTTSCSTGYLVGIAVSYTIVGREIYN